MLDPRLHMRVDAERRADLVRRAEERALVDRLRADRRVPRDRDLLLARLRRWHRRTDAPDAAAAGER